VPAPFRGRLRRYRRARRGRRGRPLPAGGPVRCRGAGRGVRADPGRLRQLRRFEPRYRVHRDVGAGRRRVQLGHGRRVGDRPRPDQRGPGRWWDDLHEPEGRRHPADGRHLQGIQTSPALPAARPRHPGDMDLADRPGRAHQPYRPRRRCRRQTWTPTGSASPEPGFLRRSATGMADIPPEDWHIHAEIIPARAARPRPSPDQPATAVVQLVEHETDLRRCVKQPYLRDARLSGTMDHSVG